VSNCFDCFCRNAELQAARDSIESLQLELAEVQRAADEAEGRLMELCEGNEALNQELHAAKVHISGQADEKEQMLRAAAAQAQQLAERAMALEDSEAQKNQANESLAMMSAKMDEMEDKVAAQEKTLAQANARYEQAQTKLDKLEGKAGSFEHISGVVKDQNESLAKELSALRRQVCLWGGLNNEEEWYFALCDLCCSNFCRWRSWSLSCKTRRRSLRRREL
jgi:predicted  nucleic acid-binding Zn-ribbon protein